MSSPERSFGPYEVLSAIGAGGMGEVYKARDRRLDRIVALKTSREQFSDRFAREARAAAALNHPHIATLHDVGPDYLVMEFVEGETLKGPQPTQKALLYARQILEALEAAHRAGIVHCDLKPANILISKSGVKLLDFGLAQVKPKIAFRDETATMSLPAEGAIAGTLQYMAPEQLEGKPADPRTDIFAFGLVLYEMLSGRRVFDGDTAASVISAIMTAQLPAMPGSLPTSASGIEKIIRQCLEKDPDDRWQSASDIRRALDLVAAEPAAAGTTPPQSVRTPSWWIAAAVISGALIAVGIQRLMRTPPPAAWAYRPLTYSGRAFVPVISPDGKQVAFLLSGTKSQDGLNVQLISGGNPLLLPAKQVRGRVAWSPDSSRIAFVADNGVNVMPALGGAARRIAGFPEGTDPADVSWSPDGSCLVIDGGFRKSLFSLPAEGGDFKPLTKPAGASDYYPVISPDGRNVAFVRRNSTYNSAAMFVSLNRDGSVAGKEQVLTTGVWNINSVDWTSDGSAVIFEGSPGSNTPSLWRVPLKGGSPVRVSVPSMNAGWPSIARQSDRMIYVSGQFETRIYKIAPGAANGGEPQLLVDAIGEHSDMAVSHDGTKIAFVSDRTGSKEVWIARADGSAQTQVTFFNGPAVGSPRWSPDGTQIVFDGYASGSSDIYLISADGGKPARLTTDAGNEVRPSWSHDGQWIYYSWDRQGQQRAIWKIRPSGGEPVKAAPSGNNAFETPDGRWLFVADPPKIFRMRPDGSEISEFSGVGRTNDWNVGGRNVYIMDFGHNDLLRTPFGAAQFERAYHFDDATVPTGAGHPSPFPTMRASPFTGGSPGA